MIKTTQEGLRPRVLFGVLICIVILGIGLRVWHYGDGLIFQSDQSRDALIIHKAIEGGFAELPLLGPQARGSSLQLGPIFYYFQYASARMFGESPESLAYPDLFFGIAFLPILFFLLRRFVSLSVALGLTLLASVSVLFTTFARFAWNPNSLPFFSTSFVLFFLMALESSGRRRWLFLTGAVVSLGIITNLHFIPAISLGIATIIFLALTRSLKWREIVFCFALVACFQSPVLLNEFQTHGAMTRAFIETVQEKGSQDNKHNFFEKTFRAYQETARITWLLATGQQNTDMILTRGFLFKCDKKCDELLPYSLAAMTLLFIALSATVSRFVKEADKKKHRDLFFILIWSGSFFLVTILVAYQISTRFYLGIAPVLFILLGLALERVMGIPSMRIRGVALVICLCLLGSNMTATSQYLKELVRSQTSFQESGRDLVFGTESKVTLGQLRALAKETDEQFIDGPVLVSGESRYARSLYYLLFVEQGIDGCYIKGSVDTAVGMNHARVYIVRNGADAAHSESGRTSFGTLGLELTPGEAGMSDQQSISIEKCPTY